MPVRAIPKLFFGPSTKFQLKSLTQPICGVRRISIPPPTCPIAFHSDTDITHKEVLEIDATAPSVIGLEIPVIFPIVSCENVGAPKADVKLSVGVPLRARWRSHLFYFFPRIANSGKSSRSDHAK